MKHQVSIFLVNFSFVLEKMLEEMCVALECDTGGVKSYNLPIGVTFMPVGEFLTQNVGSSLRKLPPVLFHAAPKSSHFLPIEGRVYT